MIFIDAVKTGFTLTELTSLFVSEDYQEHVVYEMSYWEEFMESLWLMLSSMKKSKVRESNMKRTWTELASK